MIRYKKITVSSFAVRGEGERCLCLIVRCPKGGETLPERKGEG